MGSLLLFEARAGVLQTKLWWAKCSGRTADRAEVMCTVCQEKNYTTQHIVMICTVLQPQHPAGMSSEQTLGFLSRRPLDGIVAASDMAEGDIDVGAVETTKRRLRSGKKSP